jgi:peptidoglycan hydrolase-like protein with peptidoglycan-binding domain
VPHVEVLLLPHVRRAAALVLTLAALSAATTTAFAADGSTTGGTTAQTTAPATTPAKAKKVTTRQIQKALGIKADGVMGPKTKKALKRFQKAHALKADGVAGPDTLSALGLGSTTKNSTLESAAPTNPADVAAVMAKIAQCESGGDPTAVSPSGQYRGKYQFSQETWESLGGTGDPAAADENVQDMYAAGLYNQRGLAPWPACSAQVQAQLDAAAAAPATTPAAG